MNTSVILGCGLGLSISLFISLLTSLLSWQYSFALMSLIVSVISYYRERIKSYFTSLVMNWIMSMMFENMGKGSKELKQSNLKIDNTLALINYSHNDKEYTLRLPYDPIAAKTRSKRIYAIMPDGQEINITQQPGLPYLITCQHLNAVRVEVRGRDQTVLRTYQGDETIVL